MNIQFNEISNFLLCFVRILGIFLLTPIFSQKEFFSQAKAIFAALLALFILPLVESHLPNTRIMGYDMYVYHLMLQFSTGLLIGVSSHFLFMALDLVGHFIGSESGLSNAQTLNPSLGVSTPLSTTILTISATVLLFELEFHHLIIRVLVHSFDLFDFSTPHLIEDYHTIIIRSVRKMFSLGLQFSFPFIIIGLVLNMAIGLVNKLIPQIQIFSIMQPAQLLIGFILLTIMLHPLLEGFTNLYKNLFIGLFEMP